MDIIDFRRERLWFGRAGGVGTADQIRVPEKLCYIGRPPNGGMKDG